MLLILQVTVELPIPFSQWAEVKPGRQTHWYPLSVKPLWHVPPFSQPALSHALFDAKEIDVVSSNTRIFRALFLEHMRFSFRDKTYWTDRECNSWDRELWVPVYSQQGPAILAKQLLMSSACSIMLWTNADDAVNPLKCISVWVWRN